MNADYRSFRLLGDQSIKIMDRKIVYGQGHSKPSFPNSVRLTPCSCLRLSETQFGHWKEIAPQSGLPMDHTLTFTALHKPLYRYFFHFSKHFHPAWKVLVKCLVVLLPHRRNSKTRYRILWVTQENTVLHKMRSLYLLLNLFVAEYSRKSFHDSRLLLFVKFRRMYCHLSTQVFVHNERNEIYNCSLFQMNKGKRPEIATVIAPYQATSKEQLSLQRGQLIMIRKKTTSGWWEGETHVSVPFE